MPCRCSQLVQRAFHRELGDAGAGAAHPARRVGVQRRGLLVDPHVGAGIQFGRGFPGGLDELPGRAFGQHRVLDQRRELAVRGGREADVLPGFAAERHHGEGVLAAEHQLDGSAHVPGRHGRQQQVRVGVLAAEAAHQRAQHAHLAVELEPAEQLADDAGQPVLQPEAERLAEDGGLAVGELRRHVDGQAAVGVPGREHGAGFHGVVVVRRRREDQVHRVDRGGEGVVGLADLHLARRPSAHLLHVRHPVRALLQGGRRVVGRAGVADIDQARRGPGVLERVRDDNRDALAAIAQPPVLQRQEVADLGSVQRQHLVQPRRVVVRQHGPHAGRCQGVGGVDGQDAPRGLGAGDGNRGVGRGAGQAGGKVGGVAGAARDLAPALDPARGGNGCGHGGAPQLMRLLV